ncbi:hypothetical protein N9I08_04215 [Candidatus Pelagibacter sp.]|nr:hypothetical protein [Candidatus Pelagibacter sp.]
MTKNSKNSKNHKIQQLPRICEECNRKDESVYQNLILFGYKVCKSCRLSKTIFPI